MMPSIFLITMILWFVTQRIKKHGGRFFYLALESNKSALDAKRAEQIAEECKAIGKKAYVYASHKFMSQKELTPMGITFCQLPYSIY